jgi:hypothetical protein
MEHGGKSIRDPWEETDKDGTVVMATVATVSSSGARIRALKNKTHFVEYSFRNDSMVTQVRDARLCSVFWNMFGLTPLALPRSAHFC